MGKGLVVSETQINVATLVSTICGVLPAANAFRGSASFESFVALVGAITAVFATFTKELSKQEIAYIQALNQSPGGWQSAQSVVQAANASLSIKDAITGTGEDVVIALKGKGARLKWCENPAKVLFLDFVLNKPLY
jgi:hypothetical protein